MLLRISEPWSSIAHPPHQGFLLLLCPYSISLCNIRKMRTATFFGALAAFMTTANASSAMHITLMPRAEPTATKDPWQCATENITQYFDVPKPTGSLLTALQSYGDKLIETCTPTFSGTALPSCPFPPKSLWCGFTTAAPSAVLPAYSSYGSVASSWWSAHSSAASSVAQACPVSWSKVMTETPGGEAWLYDNIVFAECYAEAHPTTGSSTTGSSATGSATTGLTATTETTRSGATGGGSTPTPTPTSTPTKAPNGVVGRTEGVEMWMVAGTGLAAAAMNSVW